MTANRELGIVVYGATGYTGKLVADYLNKQYGVSGDMPWALAGRSEDKLQRTCEELGIPPQVPRIVADASDPQSLKSMVERAAVILTTVGPYQLYGSELVRLCAEAGTDYVDLCGESNWIREMIDSHDEVARSSGARIVCSCGFDSIPFDLGVWFLQEHAITSTGAALERVRGRVRKMNGVWSGGTLASFRAVQAAAAKNPELIATLMNPFALTPGFQGAQQPNGMQPMFDEVLDTWVAPFVMATVNTKTVHRSNLLLGHRYGEQFRYDEMLITGPGDNGEAAAKAVASDTSMATDPTQPGEGPTQQQREEGFYDLLFVGEATDGTLLKAGVTGDMDPGYGSTSKMITESAVCLLKDPDLGQGGIFTPAAALGGALVERLRANAGLTFELE